MIKLTQIQTTVLHHAALGMGSKESAQKMGISQWTVRTYRKTCIAKLKARNMVQAVAEAIRGGLL